MPLNIHYLFFETLIGNILQIVPVMLLSGLIYLCGFFFCSRKESTVKRSMLPVFVKFLFVCYFSGTIALTLTPPNLWSALWYWLFYGDFHLKLTVEKMLSLSYQFVPSLYYYLKGELTGGAWFKAMILGNVLMFVPMGFLLPIIRKKDSFFSTEMLGILIILVIEMIQPFIARSFDVDDIIYNTIGVTIGFFCFTVMKKLFPNLMIKCKENCQDKQSQ